MISMTELFTEHRPWGYYTILDEGESYKVKKLVINPGERFSLQTHKFRSEFWTVVEGNPVIVCGESTKEYTIGEHVLIPRETLHRLENKTDSRVIVIEIQNGSYLGEDDIVRYADDYNRIKG